MKFPSSIYIIAYKTVIIKKKIWQKMVKNIVFFIKITIIFQCCKDQNYFFVILYIDKGDSYEKNIHSRRR